MPLVVRDEQEGGQIVDLLSVQMARSAVTVALVVCGQHIDQRGRSTIVKVGGCIPKVHERRHVECFAGAYVIDAGGVLDAGRGPVGPAVTAGTSDVRVKNSACPCAAGSRISARGNLLCR